jgi:hypothetical protein
MLEIMKLLEQRKPRTVQRSRAELDLCEFVTEKFRKSPLSVPQLAERLSEKLGEPVSTSRLYSFTASTKVSARMPAYFLRALCEVLDSDEILLFLARPRIQKQVEFADTVRELRRICDELLNIQEPGAKRRPHDA